MADTNLYARLKKLFSTNVIVRNVGGKELKVVDSDGMQAFMSNAMRDRYLRIHGGSSYGTSGNLQYSMMQAYQSQRLMFFRDYDIMDQDPIISSALDIYSEETTIKNEYGQLLTISSENEQVKEILTNLFYDILNIEFNLPWWVRNMTKYGDMFLFLEISPEYGIHNVMPLSVYDTFRYEGLNPLNPYEVYFETRGIGGQARKLENYEVAHFRLLSDGNFLPYGKSTLEGARRVWRQLTLMEDAMLIHRIMRAPEKRVFKIDIGNIPPNEVDTFIQKLRDTTKKVPFMDQQTGNYNLNYNMQNILEDFYIPVRGSDSGTDISNLGSLEYKAIDDIEYLRNKMMAALRIPKAFFGYEEALSGKTTLAAEDVRFARTVEKIQRIMVSELTKIAIVHLYAQGYTDEQLVNFDLKFASPSIIYEQEKIALWTEKINLAQSVKATKLLSDDWIYDNIFHLSDDDKDEERKKVIEDVKRNFRHMQIESGMSDPAKFGYPQDEEQPQTPMGGEMGGDPNQPPENPQGDGQVGRPEEGMKYGQDSHPRGRDPVGAKGYDNFDEEEPKNRIKSPLSMEHRKLVHSMERGNVGRKPTKVIVETSDPDKGTFLDESVIDEIHNDKM